MGIFDIFDVLGIKKGDTIKVDNPWSNSGPRDVVPISLSKNGISIRAIDTRFGNICYVGAEWAIYTSEADHTQLKEFPQIAQNLIHWQARKAAPDTKTERLALPVDSMQFEVATLEEVLKTIKLDNIKVAITGTLPIPRRNMISLLESKGASVVGSISKQTSFLFMGNTGRYEITSKMKKAHSMGVKIISL